MEEIWSKAAQQLPALALSLTAFLFMIVKGMHFFTEMSASFMRHQEERDKLFMEGMNMIGEECHRWGERREDMVIRALSDHKDAMSRQADAVTQLTSALERR